MTWEYRLISAGHPLGLIDSANAAGGEGWELVDLFLEHGFYSGVFKRPGQPKLLDAPPSIAGGVVFVPHEGTIS